MGKGYSGASLVEISERLRVAVTGSGHGKPLAGE